MKTRNTGDSPSLDPQQENLEELDDDNDAPMDTDTHGNSPSLQPKSPAVPTDQSTMDTDGPSQISTNESQTPDPPLVTETNDLTSSNPSLPDAPAHGSLSEPSLASAPPLDPNTMATPPHPALESHSAEGANG